ncbi:FecR family protein [Desertibaculum subflavum]|uniref:FecR family protein n=1 Tax=Desertibaculum subflavum TaxID=2268458 RepID=UPI000E667C44
MRSQDFVVLIALVALAPSTPAAAQGSPASAVQLAQATQTAPARALGQRIGVAGAVRGEVRLAPHDLPADAIGQIARSGDPIRLGDRIRSGPASGLQIMLLDETVFSIGPDAEMTVDEFVFDPSTDAGSVAATIGKGAFRFITGRVAAKDPKRMNVRVPQATIGIRGTIVAGLVGPLESEIVLLGPGPENDANATIGAITVSNAAGSVGIARAGFATTVGLQAPPTPPVLLPPERVRNITAQSNASIAGRPGPQLATAPGQPGNGPPPLQKSPDAGRPPPPILGPGGPINRPPPLLGPDPAQLAQQQQATITSYEQLRSVTSGTVTLALNPVTFNVISGSGSGFFGFSANIDFGMRTLNLNVNANYTLGGTPYSGPVYNEGGDYTPKMGPVSKVVTTANPANFNAGFLGTGQQATVTFDLRNNNLTGRIADNLKVGLTVSDGTNTLSAAGVAAAPPP